MSCLNNTRIVIDIGSGYSKIGYGGNNKPSFIFPTVLCGEQSEFDEFGCPVGDEALKLVEEGEDASYPLVRGKIEDWDAFEKLIGNILFKKLQCCPDDHLVGFVLPSKFDKRDRSKLAEVFFETFSVGGLYLIPNHICGISSSWTSKTSVGLGLAGTVTGVVVECGHGDTSITPMTDGYIQEGAVEHFPVVGEDLTRFMIPVVEEQAGFLPFCVKNEVARKMKEIHCYMHRSVRKSFAMGIASPEKYDRVYEGTFKGRNWKVKIGAPHRVLCPEIYFRPDLLHSNQPMPLHEVIHNSIQKCPIDQRKSLYKNIVLGGGSSLFKNFDKRLERDIKDLLLLENNSNVAVNVICPLIGRYGSWFGAAMLAKSKGFHATCVKRKQYQDLGPSCVEEEKFAYLL